MKLKKVGMRNVKTALAVAICVALSKIFKTQYIFYAAVAAVIGMQSSVSDSFVAGKNRMLGTIVGAFIGLIGVLISPDNVILCGIGTVIIIYICDLLDWQKSVTISCTVFLIIMLSLNGRPPVSYSINRTMETFLGIAVAVLVNYFVSPPKYKDKVYDERKLAIKKVFSIVQDKLCYNKDIDLKDFNREILKLEKLLNTYLSELRVKKQQVFGVDKIKEILNICKDIHMHLRIVQSLEGDCNLNEENHEKIEALFEEQLNVGEENNDMNGVLDVDCSLNKENHEEVEHVLEEKFDIEEENDDMNVVFNYHVSKIIDGLYILKNKA